MILTKKVMATVSGRNKPHFESKGYTLPYKKDSKGRLGVTKGTQLEVSVLDLPPSSNVKIEYQCDDCGAIKRVGAHTLFYRENSQYQKTGETLCSSCANKRMSGKENSQYKHGNSRYCEYRYNANKRGFEFSLSLEDFERITGMECHYCGGFSSEWDVRSRGNGIDRKDSDLGYFTNNCVPCCSKCNFVKNSMHYSDFINYIKRIAERFNEV